ncbi:hypothetical protein ACFQPF_00450 [Fictibacillus iocasae]|uniref:Uncharacterized protein n=1 Tax=Fictibacillus iocasae TaxID=2715437 RepID=A0ABW2NKS2_9BACL
MSENLEQEHTDQEELDRAGQMHSLCKQCVSYHVLAKTKDGQQVEGIITNVDRQNVTMMIPQDMEPQDTQSQGQSTREGRPYWGPRYRRWYPRIYPLAALTALSLFPYYPPYPYPPYPYPYPYPYY